MRRGIWMGGGRRLTSEIGGDRVQSSAMILVTKPKASPRGSSRRRRQLRYLIKLNPDRDPLGGGAHRGWRSAPPITDGDLESLWERTEDATQSPTSPLPKCGRSQDRITIGSDSLAKYNQLIRIEESRSAAAARYAGRRCCDEVKRG